MTKRFVKGIWKYSGAIRTRSSLKTELTNIVQLGLRARLEAGMDSFLTCLDQHKIIRKSLYMPDSWRTGINGWKCENPEHRGNSCVPYYAVRATPIPPIVNGEPIPDYEFDFDFINENGLTTRDCSETLPGKRKARRLGWIGRPGFARYDPFKVTELD